MWSDDRASRALGMSLEAVGPGTATLRMTVRDDMVNGHDIGHGGLTFTLADSAFAFARNSYNRRTVAAGAEIRFRGSPAPATSWSPPRSSATATAATARTTSRSPRETRWSPSSSAGAARSAVRSGERHGPGQRPGDHPGELEALQVERLRDTLRTAYESVPHHRHAFDAAGVHPDQLSTLQDLARFPSPPRPTWRENYPPRDVRGAPGAGGPGACEQRHHWSPDGRRLHAGRPRHLVGADGTVDPRGRRPPGDVAHVAYGYGLFTGGPGAHYGAERLGCTVVPVSGG